MEHSFRDTYLEGVKDGLKEGEKLDLRKMEKLFQLMKKHKVKDFKHGSLIVSMDPVAFYEPKEQKPMEDMFRGGNY